MPEQSGLTWPIWMAIVLAMAFIVSTIYVVFFHDRRLADMEQWVEYSYSHTVLRRAILYYRVIAIAMAVYFVLFTISLLTLQYAGGYRIYAEGPAGLFGTLLFAFDMVCRGAFFDFMEHFDLSLSYVKMNRELFWLVLYAFVFRMFYALTLLRIIISSAWIFSKISRARKGMADEGNFHYMHHGDE